MQIDPDRMLKAADQAAELLKALGNRHRLLVLCQLTDGERSVGDLANFVGLRNSTVSQHLSLLRRDGLVAARRDGQVIWYSIASHQARRVLETLFEIFCKPQTLCAPEPRPKPRSQPRSQPRPKTPAKATRRVAPS